MKISDFFKNIDKCLFCGNTFYAYCSQLNHFCNKIYFKIYFQIDCYSDDKNEMWCIVDDRNEISIYKNGNILYLEPVNNNFENVNELIAYMEFTFKKVFDNLFFI